MGKIVTSAHAPLLREWLGPAVMALLILALAATGDAGRELLRYDRQAIDAGQWWRLLTGNLVHVGWYHLLLNEIGLFVLVLLCGERLGGPAFGLGWWSLRLLCLGLGVGLGIHCFAPSTGWYVGLSGAQHGFFVLGLWRPARKGELIPIGCLVFLVGKLIWEEFTGAPLSDADAIGAPVLTWSHLCGAVAGAVYLATLGRLEYRNTINQLPREHS